MMQLKITSAPLEVAYAVSLQIPEFSSPYPITEYQQRIAQKEYLNLVAYEEEKAIGFKIGYTHPTHQHIFYSWMGGVIPEYRGKGIAQKLADEQEKWAKEKGYQYVQFKTRNQHKNMLLFALSNGFYICGFEAKDTPSTHRIYLEKQL